MEIKESHQYIKGCQCWMCDGLKIEHLVGLQKMEGPTGKVFKFK